MTKEQYAAKQWQLARMRTIISRVLDDGLRRTRRSADFLARQRRRIAAAAQLDFELRTWAQSPEGHAEMSS